jgi:Fe-S cluster assembly protein SufD
MMKDFSSHFEQFKKTRAKDLKWLQPLQKSAFARFKTLGFPRTNMENWRFTSVAPITKSAFVPGKSSPVEKVRRALDPFTLGDWKRSRLLFINGRYSPELSSLQTMPKGARVCSLAEALQTNRELVEPHLAKYASYDESAFAALNSAFVEDGAFIFLPAGSVIDDPIHILYFSAVNGAPSVSHPRTLIVGGAGSQAKFVESYVGLDGEVYLTNAVTEIVAGEGAIIDHYKLQRESRRAFHVATLQFHQDRNSSVSNHSISLGGGLVRNDINAVMDGDGGDCMLNGMYVVQGDQHVDHHTVIDHAKPNCNSRELYKGILDDYGRAVFNGRVIVRPDAQKTNAQQSNKNLLLSKDALVNTNPQLEINADDVKCAHGATIGQLDADALFYLRARGIDEETARTLLIHGFLADVSSRLRIDAVRSAIECLLMTSLPQ